MKLPEVLPRIRQHINLESDDSGDEYEQESESDEKDYREKLLVETNAAQCDLYKSSFMFISGLRSHKNLSHFGKFKCTECTYAFREEKMLKEHLEFLHAPTEDSISEDESPAGTSSHSESYIEMDSEDESPAETSKHSESDIEMDTSKITWDGWSCPRCKNKFSNEDKLENHMKNVHPQNVKKRKVNATYNDEAPHIQPKKAGKLNSTTCNICMKSFTKNYNIESGTWKESTSSKEI